MSETGLFASGYKRVTDYARSVDRLLLDLKSEVHASEETVAPVITILEAIQAEAMASPLVRLLFRRWKERNAEIMRLHYQGLTPQGRRIKPRPNYWRNVVPVKGGGI